MKIILNDGREIRLARLVQWCTYVGLLAGLPSRARNAETVQRAIEEAKPYCFEGETAFLITPTATPAEFKPASKEYLRRTGGNEKEYEARWIESNYEWLPSIVCIGVFDSGELSRKGSEVYSSMTIVWFQQEFALPIAPEVLGQIQADHWEQNAKDWSW